MIYYLNRERSEQFDLFTGGFLIKIPIETRVVQRGVLEFASLRNAWQTHLAGIT